MLDDVLYANQSYVMVITETWLPKEIDDNKIRWSIHT